MASMRSDDGFAWIARSVVLICGTAFLLVCTRALLHWYQSFHVVGQAHRVVAVCESQKLLSDQFWKLFFRSHISDESLLRVNDLKSLQQKLAATGYFSKVELSLAGDLLRLDYALYPALAQVSPLQEDSSANRSSDSMAWCLYESGQLLPCLEENPQSSLCRLYLAKNYEEGLFRQLTQTLQILKSNPKIKLEKELKSSSALGGAYWYLRELDSSPWQEEGSLCRQMLFRFEASDGYSVWLRLGPSRILDGQWLQGPKLLQLLELAKQKRALWVDARLDDLVCFKKGDLGD